MAESIVIDVRGLKCPLPVLKTAQRMRNHASGTQFRVLATDPLAKVDLPHFCNEAGHRLLGSGYEEGALTFHIEKG